LIDVDGTLYGTTVSGGLEGGGTVFKITTSGTESVVYSFGGGSDGAYPYGGLVHFAGALYGTTFMKVVQTAPGRSSGLHGLGPKPSFTVLAAVRTTARGRTPR
jgi:uncharacterized repeat protein (TIGR03803 family)